MQRLCIAQHGKGSLLVVCLANKSSATSVSLIIFRLPGSPTTSSSAGSQRNKEYKDYLVFHCEMWIENLGKHEPCLLVFLPRCSSRCNNDIISRWPMLHLVSFGLCLSISKVLSSCSASHPAILFFMHHSVIHYSGRNPQRYVMCIYNLITSPKLSSFVSPSFGSSFLPPLFTMCATPNSLWRMWQQIAAV